MIYRATGGLFLALYGVELIGWFAVPAILLGVLALVAGVALLAGK